MSGFSDDCFATGGALMPLGEALDLLAGRVGPVVGGERVGLRTARGRVLAADVRALRSVPPEDNAAVDGYAVRVADLDPARTTRLRLVGRAAAGHPFVGAVRAGEAVRIFTGAAVPPGCDAVVMQEDCRLDGDQVIVPAGVKQGANRRLAGEDIAAGSVVLARGRRLRAQDLGLAAAAGHPSLEVFRPLRAAVFSTGDELHEPAAELPAGGICDANRYALIALLEDLGCTAEDLGILGDRFAVIRDALAAAAREHDLIVTSGGMSVGEEDHVKTAVEALGRLHFWRLAIKPGRPIGLGQVHGVPFVGLPGNPVAMMVTFMRIARPMILRLAGADAAPPHAYRVPAAFSFSKKAGRREWLRARLIEGEGGALVATRFSRQGSGILSSMVAADGLIELAEDVTRIAPGELVDFLPFTELGR